MPMPAARVGDMAAHGGTILPPGNPTVLIGGMPAACVGDQCICPFVTPAVPPIPHVNATILPPGGVTVLIGGRPAARVGDQTICTGGGIPGVIIGPGAPTVLIGP